MINGDLDFSIYILQRVCGKSYRNFKLYIVGGLFIIVFIKKG